MRKLPPPFLALWLILFTFSSPGLTFGESISISVKGMVCQSCVESVTHSLKSHPDVETVSIDLNDGLVSVSSKSQLSPSDDEVKKLIESAGYEAISIRRNPEELKQGK